MNEGARGAPSTLMGISSLCLCLFGQTDGIDELDQTDTVFGLQLCFFPPTRDVIEMQLEEAE